MNFEIQKMCSTCEKGENFSDEPCPTRPGCFTPEYENWVAPGEAPEQQDGIQSLLDMELNEEKGFLLGRYIRVPGGWIFENCPETAMCFIPEPK